MANRRCLATRPENLWLLTGELFRFGAIGEVELVARTGEASQPQECD